jgi:hypothetical protein
MTTTLVCADCGKPVERTFDDDFQHVTRADGLACTVSPVRPVRAMDDLDALRYAAETRAILANAGRTDLAGRAWNLLCPQGVPLQVRYDALVQAGYPFRQRGQEAGQ